MGGEDLPGRDTNIRTFGESSVVLVSRLKWMPYLHCLGAALRNEVDSRVK